MQDITRKSFISGAALGLGAAVTATSVAVADEAVAEQSPTVEAGYLSYIDWLGKAPEVGPQDASQVIDADIVVVGGGNAGLCTALAAAELGAKVAVVEKQPEDSYAFFGEDIGTLNSAHTLSLGGQQIDEVEFIQDWTRRNLNRTNPALVRQFAYNSGAVLDWYLSHVTEDVLASTGVFSVPLPTEFPGQVSGYRSWAAALHFDGQGEGSPTNLDSAAKQLVAAAEALGATWYFDQQGIVVVKDEAGRATGVIARDSDGAYTLYNAAKAVVLAAGDYAGNPAMVFGINSEYRNFVEARGLDWTEIYGNGRSGDGQKMGCWAGGRMEPGPHASMCYSLGAGAFGGLALPQFNREGKRFMDEGVLGVWGNYFQTYRQPMGRIFSVADANWEEFVQRNAPEHVYPGTGAPGTGGFLTVLQEELPKVAGTGTEGYKIRGCMTYCADTLEELADNLGLDPEAKENFLAEIAHYNELCEAGRDADFGKDPLLLVPIATPPFYASVVTDTSNFKLGLVELGGLVTDGNQQVLGAADLPIEGLYATGNCCGGRFAMSYQTPIAGISIGWAVTMGKLLGDQLAAL